MGTWAAGNFDSDGALDFLGDLVDQLTNTITECFSEDNADLDEGGESELMPSVAILVLLTEQCNAAPPQPAVIRGWHKKYLKIYDKQIDELEPQGSYKSQRRKVIDRTFTQLLKLSTKFWKK